MELRGVSKGGRTAAGVFSPSPESRNYSWGAPTAIVTASRLYDNIYHFTNDRWFAFFVFTGPSYFLSMTNDILTITPEDAKGNPRAPSVRIQARTLSQAYGQRRHDFRVGEQPEYVDPSRSDLNRYLMQPRPLPDIKREIVALRKQAKAQREIKSNAAIVTAGIITFGHEAQVFFNRLTPDQQDDAFRELASAIADRLQTSLESLSVHLDESAIHCHFELRAYTDLGQPISKTANRPVTSILQDLAATILAKYCPEIERGYKKWDRVAAGADISETINRSVKELHHDLPFEIAAKQKELEEIQATIQDLVNSAEKDRGRVAKLEAKEQLNAKEEERLKDYRARLDKKETTLVAMSTQIDVKTAALADKVSALNARQSELDRRQIAQDLRALDQDATEMAHEVNAAELEDRATDLERGEIAVSSAALANTIRSAELDGHDAAFGRRQAEQEDQQTRLEETETALAAVSAEIEVKTAALADSASALDARQLDLAGRHIDQNLRAFDQDIRQDVQDARSVELEDRAADLDRRATAVTSGVLENATRLADLDARDAALGSLQSEQEDQQAKLDETETDLVAMSAEIFVEKAALADRATALDARQIQLDRRQVQQDVRSSDQDAREGIQDAKSAELEDRTAVVDHREVAVTSGALETRTRSAALDVRDAALGRQLADQDRIARQQQQVQLAQKNRSELLDEREAGIGLEIEEAVSEVAALTSRTISSIITGEVFLGANGKWRVPEPDMPALQKIWSVIVPALKAVRSWWQGAQAMVDALSDPDRKALLRSLAPPEVPADGNGPEF